MNWYLIRAATRQELRAESALKELGFEVYYPTYRRFERVGRQKVWEERRRALFPGYLFVLTRDGEFADVEAADGVSGFVRYTGPAGDRCPRDVSFALLVEIQAVVASGEHDEGDPNMPAGMAIGDYVRVTGGPFMSLMGKVSAKRGSDRVRVLLDAVQRGAPVVPIELKVADLELVA